MGAEAPGRAAATLLAHATYEAPLGLLKVVAKVGEECAIHISPTNRLASKLASERYFESLANLIEFACKPMTARMPMENIKMEISASSSITPR